MANRSRPLAFLVVFAVSIVGSWFIGCSRPETVPLGPAPGNHLMKVGPAAASVGAVIQNTHKIFWKPRDAKMKLEIRFKASEFPKGANGEPPFEGGTNNTDQVFTCGAGIGGVCDSGKVNHLLPDPLPADGLYYKYWQTLIHEDGTKDQADAGIIIEK